jgi:hypothetical protein
MAYKPLMVFIATLSILILCMSLNTQTNITIEENNRTFAEKTGTLIGNNTGDTGRIAGNVTEKSKETTDTTTDPHSTLGLGFTERTEREHIYKKKRPNNKKITKQ